MHTHFRATSALRLRKTSSTLAQSVGLLGLICMGLGLGLGLGAATASAQTGKKGVGLAESAGWGEAQLQALRVDWYYNWGPDSAVRTRVPFVPMAYSPRSLAKLPPTSVLLGFNEPDHPKQAKLSVPQALAAWPELRSRAQRVGSPAVAGNAVRGDWLPTFMQARPEVDFVTLHWYKGPAPQRFIQHVQTLCAAYGKPVWVTEFAPQTAAQARAQPDQYSTAQVTQFIATTVAWMNASPCVERFAWHDAKTGSSALFNAQGQLTPTGEAYAKAK